MQNAIRYWAYRGFEEKALQNGSFIRLNARGEYDKYSNSQYVGSLDEIYADQFSPVATDLALRLIPEDLANRFRFEEAHFAVGVTAGIATLVH